MEHESLTAEGGNGFDWCVADKAGMRWWPKDEATAEEIRCSHDPEATILRMCREEPARGTWAD